MMQIYTTTSTTSAPNWVKNDSRSTPIIDIEEKPLKFRHVGTEVSHQLAEVLPQIKSLDGTLLSREDVVTLSRRHLSHETTLGVPPTEMEEASDSRIALLARKYVDKRLTTEEAARLEILTEKLRNLWLSVSGEELEIMESISESLNRADSVNNSIKDKYGLK